MTVLALCAGLALAAEPATAQARADAAIGALQQVRAAQSGGQASAEDVHRWSMRVLEAERALGREGAAQDHLRRMQALEASVKELAAQGMVGQLEVDASAFFVAEAEALVEDGMTTGGAFVPPPPEPVFLPPPPAPVLAPSSDRSTSIEACFTGCDNAFATCTTEAEHFRLGVGALDPGDAECAQKAEQKCGTGKNAAATDCRDQANRACQAERRSTGCSRSQTQCNARCR